MSSDKHRSLGRRLALLENAKANADAPVPYRIRGIPLHMEGGMAQDNPDLQRLHKDGLVTFERTGAAPKWSKRFKEAPMRSWCSTDYIRRSFAAITVAGRDFLARHTSS